MMHAGRRFSISDRRQTIAEVAEELCNTTWCCCNGFLVEGLLLLNDATCEDGAQEFAVFKCEYTLAQLEEEPRELGQIESLTCSWMKPPKLYATLMRLAGKEIPSDGSMEYAALKGSGLVPLPAPAPTSGVIVADSVASLTEALSDGKRPPPKVFAMHKIKTHKRDEYCGLCA